MATNVPVMLLGRGRIVLVVHSRVHHVALRASGLRFSGACGSAPPDIRGARLDAPRSLSHHPGVAELPAGTVTLLFTDVEGSTRLLHELGDRYADVLAEHRRLLRRAFVRHGGVEVDTQGDAFFVAFERAADAVAAAAECNSGLAGGPIRVRIGIHTGEPLVTEEGYVGVDVHRAARIMSAGHGGQVLLSEKTRALIGEEQMLTDLGLHRLKDMRRPEKLFQLGDHVFPPLKTLDATNLPVAASPLLGRERELAELRALLAESRLVTVTGPGGTGKTRLALQVVAELVGSPKDGVFWVPLADLADPALVLPTIAQRLGARGDLREFLRGKELVLLLDNFEHLLPAAPAVAELLATTKGLRLIVTSRAPLHLSGEQEYPLEPLRTDDAVTLFLERARGVGRTFARDQTAERICRRLDCLPLAIELAAARTRLLAPETLLERLDHALALLTGGARDAPGRQQTLRATIEWSHALLDDRSRDLFARLAVFAGAFSLQAATSICATNIDVLQDLVEASLVKSPGGDRYLMLETIREYAAERLDARDDAIDVRRRHADFFTSLSEEAQHALRRNAVRLELAEDEPNLRAALAYCAETRDSELMLRLVSALYFFWFNRDQIEEGTRWLEKAIETAPPSKTHLRARALKGLAVMHGAAGNVVRADALLEEALGIAREIGDQVEIGSCLNNLGVSKARQNDIDAAEDLFDQALAMGRDPVPLTNLTHMALVKRDYVKARKRAEECLSLSRETGNDVNEVMARRDLAAIAALEGRYDVAAPVIRELLGGARYGDLHRHTIECVVVAAYIAWMRGNEDDADTLARAAVAERTRLGWTPWELPHYPYAEALIRARDKKGRGLPDEDDEALPLDDAVQLALACLDQAAEFSASTSSQR
jgi:predicted ATPase/class 3 adenylate cyclase